MLSGVLSDEYIRQRCWDLTTPLAFGLKSSVRPTTIKASGNMRRDFTFPQERATLINLAQNVLLATPKKNQPANADLVVYVAERLLESPADVPVRSLREIYAQPNPLLTILETLPVGLDREERREARGQAREERQMQREAEDDRRMRRAEREAVPPLSLQGPFSMGALPRQTQAILRSDISRQATEGFSTRQSAIYGEDLNNPLVTPARSGALRRIPEFQTPPPSM